MMEGTEENEGTKSTEENKGRNGRRKGIEEWKEEVIFVYTYIYIHIYIHTYIYILYT